MSRCARKYRPEFWDPAGARHGGLPTYWWRGAPEGLATRRQLRAMGLRPAGQRVAAQILWYRRGSVRVAYLYQVDRAAPKRTATGAQRAALARAMTARQTCGTCGVVRDYCIPHSLGECLDCHYPRDDRPVVDPWAGLDDWREAA